MYYLHVYYLNEVAVVKSVRNHPGQACRCEQLIGSEPPFTVYTVLFSHERVNVYFLEMLAPTPANEGSRVILR